MGKDEVLIIQLILRILYIHVRNSNFDFCYAGAGGDNYVDELYD